MDFYTTLKKKQADKTVASQDPDPGGQDSWAGRLNQHTVTHTSEHVEIRDTLRNLSFKAPNFDLAQYKHRKYLMREGLDFENKIGLEIGPLCRPILRKEEADILYTDYVDAESLRSKYKESPDVIPEEIVDLDFICGEKSFSELLQGRKIDYAIASHVAEHVPDLITWLRDLCEILHKGGAIRLTLPDARFSFDVLRNQTEYYQLLLPYAIGAKKPQPHQLMDHFIHQAKNMDGWRRFHGDLDITEVTPVRSTSEAISQFKEAISHGGYVDVHCWAFTPSRFAVCMARLCEDDLLQTKCAGFVDTSFPGGEFCVFLEKSSEPKENAASWMQMASGCPQ